MHHISSLERTQPLRKSLSEIVNQQNLKVHVSSQRYFVNFDLIYDIWHNTIRVYPNLDPALFCRMDQHFASLFISRIFSWHTWEKSVSTIQNHYAILCLVLLFGYKRALSSASSFNISAHFIPIAYIAS